jgi:hypothetical protein
LGKDRAIWTKTFYSLKIILLNQSLAKFCGGIRITMPLDRLNRFLEWRLTSAGSNFKGHDAGVQILDSFCIILPMIAFLSPVTVYYSVFFGRKVGSQTVERERSDENALPIPPLPVTSQLLNCFLFGIYAHYTWEVTLLIPNATGAVMGLVFVALYPFGMSSKFRNQYVMQVGLVVLVGAVSVVSLYSFNLPSVPSDIGMVIGVIMSCYPVPVMVRAVKTQNSGILGSVWMNFAMFCCCGSWVVHAGVVHFDPTVFVANLAGVLAQGLSLCIHFSMSGKEPLGESDINLNDGTWSAWFLVTFEGARSGGAREDAVTDQTPLLKG